MIRLAPEQKDALEKMHNGCILNGRVGSGKSLTALAYYFKLCGGDVDRLDKKIKHDILDLYIITTARKRDEGDWEREMAPFLMSPDPDKNLYSNSIVIDSWNNIKKYKDVKGAFFIFDEQRVIGDGTWSKTFMTIAKSNQWILLSATPGDKWIEYAPVFIANGFYKNITEFRNEHCKFARFSKFPVITGYFNEGRLRYYQKLLLVDIDYDKPTTSHHIDIWCKWDKVEYRRLMRERFDNEKKRPFQSITELALALRKLVNGDQSRIDIYKQLCHESRRVIVFYNYNYELDILRKVKYDRGVKVAEWNGHKHEPIPDSDRWVYLVQYTAGAEGWNCIETNTLIFYSQTYSYKQEQQACGRIDRRNTPYKDLYYYHLKSRAPIDLGIEKALKDKKEFNERAFFGSS